MATQKPDRFDEVNWEEMSKGSRFNLSLNTKVLLAGVIPLFSLAFYDWQFVGDREATFGVIGWDATLNSVDYMFIFTLILFGSFVVLPLFQHRRMTKYYWKEFKRNKPAVVSLVWLIFIFAGGLLGPLVLDPPTQDILVGHQPPVYMTIVETHTPTCVGEVSDGLCHGTWKYPLGTTQGGKGIFTSLVHGMTISMKVGFIATTIAVTIGTLFGTVSAYAGGLVDEVLMRYVDIQQSLPTLIIYLLILYIWGGGLWLLILLLGIFSWGGMARYVRSKSLGISEEEYIKATKISGAGTYRIVRRHIVPNSASSIITDITLLIPAFLLAEAQLSFLGLGDPSIPSWGQVIAAGRSDLAFAPWITMAPGILLFFTILAFNFLGDALLDALNPKAEAESES